MHAVRFDGPFKNHIGRDFSWEKSIIENPVCVLQ
jgi:hypothetical protein